MLSQYYVSPTLLNAWLNGYDSFLPMLKREEIETTDAMTKGLDFEKDIIDGKYPELNFLNGCLYQTMHYKKINDYIGVFGYSDFIKYDTIYDAKCTSSYELGKYKKSCQHLVYTYCMDMEKFEYIINNNGNIYFEGYLRNDQKLFNIIRQFVSYLELTDLKKYFELNYNIDRKRKEIEENAY